jgi:hypothetical protein
MGKNLLGTGIIKTEMIKLVKVLRIISLSVLILSLCVAIGCAGATKIGDILADTSQYEGKEITIKGTVEETVWLAAAEKGTYQLGDGTGNIWVITTQPPPQKGQSISTQGKVQSAFSILGSSYGTVLIETQRR